MINKPAVESKLTCQAQKEVDTIVRDYGLKGIGYFTIQTTCTTCKYDGYVHLKLGTKPPQIHGDWYCIKCGNETVVTR